MALEYGRMLLNIGFRAVGSMIPGGALVQLTIEEFGPAFCQAAWEKLKGFTPSERQAAMEQLGQISVDEARGLAEEAIRTTGIEGSVRAQAVEYLAAIPMAARRTLVQAPAQSPGGGALSLPATAVPSTQSDLMRFLPLRPPRFRPGDRIPGHDYRLERMLGQGGFGEVWLATNPQRPRQAPRALKFCLDEPMRRSLERETDLLDRIEESKEHPGIVRLLQTALSNDPPFLVYEYVDGGDLTGWLAVQPERRPDPVKVAALLVQVADALAYAHRLGLVHRDLKPSNVLIALDGKVKVTDFGIGAVVAEQELARTPSSAQWTTRAAALQGACTPMYADRAQRRGEAVDARADIYAVGVMAYQLLLGDVALELSPYYRDELEAAGVPAQLLGVVASCLTLPERRYKDGGALLEALKPVFARLGPGPVGPGPGKLEDVRKPEPPPPPPPPPQPPPPPPPKQRKRGRVLKGVGAAMVALAGLGFVAADGDLDPAEALMVLVPGLALYAVGFAQSMEWSGRVVKLVGFAGLAASLAVAARLDRPDQGNWGQHWSGATNPQPLALVPTKGAWSGAVEVPYDDLPEEETEVAGIGGFWQGANGMGYQIQQQGNRVFLQEVSQYGATGAGGQGTISGNQIDMQYRTSLGAMGRGQLQVTADGRQISGTFTDLATGMVVQTMLYRP